MRQNIDNIIGKFIEIRDLLKNVKEPSCNMTDGEVLDEVYAKIDDISETYKKIGSIFETKYSIGQRVWTIYDNKVASYDIMKIKYEIEDTLGGIITNEKYQLYGINNNRWFDVSQLFSSTEELIKSL